MIRNGRITSGPDFILEEESYPLVGVSESVAIGDWWRTAKGYGFLIITTHNHLAYLDNRNWTIV